MAFISEGNRPLARGSDSLLTKKKPRQGGKVADVGRFGQELEALTHAHVHLLLLALGLPRLFRFGVEASSGGTKMWTDRGKAR